VRLCTDLKAFFGPRVWDDQDKECYEACFKDGRIISAEIRVVGNNGRVYASPMMLVHYVEAHGYLPPQEFIDAVMQIVRAV
jgi:hypothetical protein